MKKLYLLSVLFLLVLYSNAQLTGISPAQGVHGQTLRTTITSSGFFIQVSSPTGNIQQIRLLKGLDVIVLFSYYGDNLNVIHSDTLIIDLEIPANAQDGVYDLEVSTGDTVSPGWILAVDTLPGVYTVLPPDGYVSGTVYDDLNKNGIKDIGEPGIPNRSVTLYPHVHTETTDVNGNYNFPVLNGIYTIVNENKINDYRFVTSINDSIPVTISNNNSPGNDFGLKYALDSVTPNQGYQGFTTTHLFVANEPIFVPGPNGNVSKIEIKSSPNFYVYQNFITVIDSFTIQAIITVPPYVVGNNRDIHISLNNGPIGYGYVDHILKQQFDIAPSEGKITGTVFLDLNKDGVKDIGEPGVAAYPVKLAQTGLIKNTDANGNYSFPVINGNYAVVFQPSNFPYMFLTSQADSLFVTVNNDTVPGNDFGVKNALMSITPDTAFAGLTSTHQIISDEPIFMPGAFPYGVVDHVYIFSSPGISVPATSITVIDSFTIDFNVTIPSNTQTGNNLDLRVYIDSAYVGHHFLRQSFNVAPPSGFVMGSVFNDLNTNGIKDPGEQGIQGYTIKLLPSNTTAITDVNGNYSIAAWNGNYSVVIQPNTSNIMFHTSADTLSAVINFSNDTGNNFGLKYALASIAPSIGYKGITTTHQIVSDEPIFYPGGNPYGNVSQVYILASPGFSASYNAITVIDSFTIQVSLNVPVNTQLANNLDLRVNLSTGLSGNHYLKQQFNIDNPPSLISGRMFFDLNQNKINDAGEAGINYAKAILIPDNSIAFSDVSGNFQFGSLGGQQMLIWVNTIPGISLFTDSTTYSFIATGNITGKNFGFISTQPDYSIEVKNLNLLPRCNSQQSVAFKIHNFGNNIYDVRAWLKFDPLMTYISSQVPPDLISNDTIYWNLPNIQPFTDFVVRTTFELPGAGNAISFSAGASSLDSIGVPQLSDAEISNYSITCSWDPNDKQVIPEGIFAQNFTLMTDTLEYLIRFQNTGNDTAFNVVVLDTLDSNLNFNTFELLGSSHLMQTQIQSNGAIKFTFNNILLVDSNANEPESHGYIRYRIKAQTGLPDNTPVYNTAHIFFDFNPDVVTNTTFNTLVYVLPVGMEEAGEEMDVSIYPNPFSHSATLQFDNPSGELFNLTISDVAGKVVAPSQSTKGNGFIIEKNKLAGGVYIFRLVNNLTLRSYTGKLIIE